MKQKKSSQNRVSEYRLLLQVVQECVHSWPNKKQIQSNEKDDLLTVLTKDEILEYFSVLAMRGYQLGEIIGYVEGLQIFNDETLEMSKHLFRIAAGDVE